MELSKISTKFGSKPISWHQILNTSLVDIFFVIGIRLRKRHRIVGTPVFIGLHYEVIYRIRFGYHRARPVVTVVIRTQITVHVNTVLSDNSEFVVNAVHNLAVFVYG